MMKTARKNSYQEVLKQPEKWISCIGAIETFTGDSIVVDLAIVMKLGFLLAKLRL
jgi:hypothetical protein